MSTKVSRLVCFLLFRLLLPVILLAACVLRYNVLSFLYLVFLLIAPLLRSLNQTTIKGGSGLYLKLLIVVGSLGTLAQIVFHIVLAAIAKEDEPYGYHFSNCSTNEIIARTIAVERLDGVPFAHVLRLVLPDVGVLIAAILTFVIPYKLLNSSPQQQEEDLLPVVHRRKKRFDSVFQFIGEFLIVLFLAACGIIVPSVLSAVYFLSFLYIATWWAFYQRLGRKFAYYRFFILVWSGLHLLVLYLYQLQPFQEDWLPGKDSVVARLLGLTAVIRTDCDKPWSVEFHDGNNWPQFVNPGLLLVLYVVAAVEVRIWYHKKRQLEDDMDGNQVKRSRRQKRRSLERQSLVGDDNPTYSTFEDRGQVAEEPDTPRMSAVFESDDEADGGVQSKPKKRKKKDIKRLAAVTVFVFVMKQSYVLSLIAMMAWSITFHSWLTFVLLLGACFIWMVPQSRRACLLCSPFIMFYGMGLLIIQFVYGMNLTELPEKVNGVSLSEIGLKKFTYPCLQLGLQIIFTSTFWLTMRQYMRERQQQKLAGSSDVPMEPIREDGQQRSFSSWLNITSQDDIDGYDSNTMKIIDSKQIDIGGFVWSLLAKYWIFVCTGMMLLISIQEVVVYRIIYLVLFLSFVLVFQLSYKLWRLTMFLFWWVVIVYSIIVLIILYTYQFKEFPGYWHNATGLSMDVLSDLGLEQYDTAGLFVRLLTPTSFLILIILQVHYFHKTFMKISDLEQSKNVENHSSVAFTTDTEGGTTTTDTEGSLFRKTKRWKRKLKKWFIVIWTTCTSVWKTVSSILWRLTEIHVIKVVAFVIIMVCVTEVSAISAVYVILLGLFLPITGAWAFMCHLCQVWTAIVMVAKMIYQLNLVEKDYWITNCTMDVANQTVNGTEPPANPFANGTINNALWVGLAKADSFSYYLQNYIGILLILAFERIVHYHQIQYCNLSGLPKPAKGIIFLEIKRENADRNLLNCSKFFANYFFYKYGLEICYIMFAVTISVRVDAYSVLYAILLGILLFLPRRGNARIWPLFTIILAVLLPIQFLLCLGLPTGLCQEYPWDSNSAVTLDLEKWLFLPDYYNPLDSYKLIADFFLLLFMCLQWNVFRMEMSNHWKEYGGGDNGDILPEVVAKTPIPVADFTSSARSYLDVLKNVFFTYMFWVTLFVVFMAGLSRINIFSMGYVISVFIFMWYGQEFLLKPLDKIRQRWKLLIGYTFLVMFLKAALQLLGCVYITYVYTDFCWLIQLLGLTCLSPSRTYNPGSGDCIVEEDDTGLKWDVVCFTFLLLQLRIYNCHYFRHIVSTAEAQARLSSRGAELINSILIKEVQEQREEEKKVLQNIKKKMEYLKQKQKNKTSEDYKEPDDHFQAIRSGDYYLFDEESDNEEDKEHPTSITIGMDKSDREGEDGGLDPIQLISTAIESGAKAAVDQAETDDEDGNKASQQRQGEAKEDDKGDDADDEDDDDNGKESMFSKLKTVMTLIMKLLESLADTLIGIFNNISKNYRLVAESLEKDMQIEKEKIAASNKGLSETDQRIPLDSSAEDGGATEARDGDETDAADLVEIQLVPADGEFSHGDDEVDGLAKSKQAKFERNKSKIYLLFEATLYVMVAKSEIVCYFLMILNQILYASLLSLPLPLMVFLWGMLSVPRPSKTFWITIITYTEAVVVVKYLFQFNFFFWNEDTLIQLSPFWPPRIIGVEKKSNYAVADLVLLLALFIHRSILKRYGLWKDAEDITADLSKVEKGMSPPTTPTTVPEREDIISSLEDGSGSIQESTDVQSSGESKDGTKSKQKEKKKSSKSKMLLEPFKKFYAQLTNAAYNATTDVYASMFFCDFINFLIIVFGYWAFGPAESASGDVTSYIRDDRVPVLFLIMLLTQFILIIIDRALYLRKFIPGKFVFQIFLVIIIHVWMFFILPYVTERKFADNAPAQLFYFVKCVYFGLSAYQIRSSYPTRILGNFLTKKYNYLNLFLFKGFLAIPFLLELRVLMDWIWTDSTMAIGSWLQMEDIYANIYMLKCWREIERKYPTPRAIKKRALIKYGVGGLLLFLVIFIIWFPLVLFSFANTVYIANPPYECTSTIAVSGFQPLVHIQAQGNSIQRFSANDYSTLQNDFKSNPSAAGFINGYEASDITRIKLNGDSTSVWGISPPNRQELIQYLNDTSSSAKMEFDLTFTRDPTSGEAGQTLSNQFTLGLDRDTRKRLADMIHSNTAGVDSVIIRGLFPRYLHLSSKGSESVNTVLGVDSSNISASLRTEGNTSIPGSVLEWWQVKECEFGVVDCSTTSDDLVIVTFNDRVAPAGLSFISGYGIIGLYISLVFVIGQFVRLLVSRPDYKVMYEELPSVDRILRLCLNIYMARETLNFKLEEDLYAKLLFLYRCPKIMIEWTRMKYD